MEDNRYGSKELKYSDFELNNLKAGIAYDKRGYISQKSGKDYEEGYQAGYRRACYNAVGLIDDFQRTHDEIVKRRGEE